VLHEGHHHPARAGLDREETLGPVVGEVHSEPGGDAAYHVAFSQGLGHGDIRMVANYNHVVSEDGRLFAAKLGRLLEPQQNLRLVMPTGSA